jgi:hypothetical protein
MTIARLLDRTLELPPEPARIIDALTGGLHNFSCDRQVAQQLLDADPNLSWWVSAHHHFRTQAMIALASAGIRQWIDLGCGMANAASAYTLLADDPGLGGGRLVCVDNDPVAITHLCTLPPPANADLHVTALCAGLREPHQVMADIAQRDAVDLGEPVAILLTNVLQYLDDTAAVTLLTALREYITTGSYLVLSHPSSPRPMTAPLRAAITHFQHITDTTWALREPDTAMRLLAGGWIPQPPGIVAVGQWHPACPANEGVDDQDDLPWPDAMRDTAGWAVLATAAPPRP